jgi:hypothetical protein
MGRAARPEASEDQMFHLPLPNAHGSVCSVVLVLREYARTVYFIFLRMLST